MSFFSSSLPLEQDPFVITSIFEYVSSRPIQSIILSVDLGISLLLVGCIFETLLRPSKLAFLTHPLTAAEYLLHDELLKRRKARLAIEGVVDREGLVDGEEDGELHPARVERGHLMWAHGGLGWTGEGWGDSY